MNQVTDHRSAVGGVATRLRDLPPEADLVPELQRPIIEWPQRDLALALELGRSAAFLEEMQRTPYDKRAWLATIVQGVRERPAELSATLRGRTIVVGDLLDDIPFTFREV